MSIFVLSDLHLSTNIKTNKSMEVFGSNWQNYIQRIEKNWKAVVDEEDSVIIPGDISWALRLDEAYSDLHFIDSLPGHKYLGKGNHDFWWSTVSKLTDYFNKNKFFTLSVLYNNAYIVENAIICGTRGWFPDEDSQTSVNDPNYSKIINREINRLKISLDSAKVLYNLAKEQKDKELPIIVFMHFPPVYNNKPIDEFVEVLKSYNVSHCYYGHIHNNYTIARTFVYDSIPFTLTSSDYLGFLPMKIN